MWYGTRYRSKPQGQHCQGDRKHMTGGQSQGGSNLGGFHKIINKLIDFWAIYCEYHGMFWFRYFINAMSNFFIMCVTHRLLNYQYLVDSEISFLIFIKIN